MKQPELGKKVSDLRKAKGLTQEELVEKCNLNVRTIQRIEAGEVSPRTYTIKAIFEALEYHWEKDSEMDSQSAEKPSPLLYISIGAAIIYFFLSILEIGMEQEFLGGEVSFSLIGYTLIKAGTYFFYILFLLGWLKLTLRFPNRILTIALWVMVGANVIWFIIDMIALFTDVFSIGDYYMIKVSSFGFIFAFLGFGYLGYKKEFSSMATIMGVLLILAGVLMFTGIGVFLALIPWTLAEIVQIGLMIYLIQKIGSKKTPDFTV
ncbi:helix-turn-helix transcriptional regulator [Algoriphagus sp. SE2]|uniref:helix-turn-helix domain-containing protein n=1 Tax=Algoriphagus sp. SE2 TaxID=3141536 RepID=UPI0031CD1AC8